MVRSNQYLMTLHLFAQHLLTPVVRYPGAIHTHTIKALNSLFQDIVTIQYRKIVNKIRNLKSAW